MRLIPVIQKRTWTPNPADAADRQPENTAAPELTGSGVWGEEVTCSTGTWKRAVQSRFTYQWQLDDVDINGATANSYTPLEAQVDGVLKCVVMAHNISGAVTEDSDTVTVVEPA